MELFKPSPIECQKYLARAKLPENEHYTVQGNALLFLNKKYHFADFTKSTLRNYPDYVKLYRTFIKTFGLEQFSLREIDLYLWNLGKEISRK